MATNATTIATTSTATLPSALAFLVSNFHSLVNIKLDGSNYMLWRIQVESVMEANGFIGYLDGSISSLYAPQVGREDDGRDLGPMFGVVQ